MPKVVTLQLYTTSHPVLIGKAEETYRAQDLKY